MVCIPLYTLGLQLPIAAMVYLFIQEIIIRNWPIWLAGVAFEKILILEIFLNYKFRT